MSESEEDGSNKQKSIFSGMSRVKQINHLREKWSPKTKSFVDASSSSSWNQRLSSDKFLTGRRAFHHRQSDGDLSHHESVPRVVDMDRYLAITTWLKHNDIDIARLPSVQKDGKLFDHMYNSLEVLEKSLNSEISHLSMKTHSTNETCPQQCPNTTLLSTEPLTPPLFDYLTVIGADLLDINIRNFWKQKENVFEATVAFASPPESQFHAESLEHFCFPTGIKASSKSSFENPSIASKEGDFFVFMLSGGGIQGQSVQYAMCMKGMIQLRTGRDDDHKLLLPICYCIIAQIPFIPFFRQVLQTFLDHLRTELDAAAVTGWKSLSNLVTDKHAGYIDDMLQTLKKLSLPDKGRSLRVDTFPVASPGFILARPHNTNDVDEKVALLLQWSLPSLLCHVSIHRLLEILSYLLIEMKLIVVSDKIPLLSCATLGLASLLHPLVWAGPLISVLPPSMHEYMEAPVPLICGVDELPQNFDFSKGTCILYLTENRVRLHPEDERAFASIQMPEVKNLSRDLTRFTTQIQTGSFRDIVTPLSSHLIIHRVRRHVSHLISVCSHLSEPYESQDMNHHLEPKELRFVHVFMRTQMYQKYQDDQPLVHLMDQREDQMAVSQPLEHDKAMKASSISTQHDELKTAAKVLFQIALAGVNALPQRTSLTDITTNAMTETNDSNTQSQDTPWTHEVEPVSSPTLPAASAISARSVATASLTEVVELLSHDNERTASRRSETSEKRLDRSFGWHSELDDFLLSDEASIVSPGSAQDFDPFMSETFESRCCSPTNDEDTGKSDEHGAMTNLQRGDTETTISIFETAMSETLEIADALDDSWFEHTENARPSPHESDDDRASNHESLVKDNEVQGHVGSNTNDERLDHNNSSSSLWHQDSSGRTELLPFDNNPFDSVLTPAQWSLLTRGISMESRGAWQGWCAGKMFVSGDLSTLTWEQRPMAAVALNMRLVDITEIAYEEDGSSASSSDLLRRHVQLKCGPEVIDFQSPFSSLHDDFFHALQQLIPPVHDENEAPSSLSSPLAMNPQVPSPIAQKEESDIVPLDPTFQDTAPDAFSETFIDQFKQKLQSGFLVEKHGRYGPPHARLLFTDASCSHIMWRKPTSASDQVLADNRDDQFYHRCNLFTSTKHFPVECMTAIVTGKQTTVFRRATATKSNDRMCLSILTSTRTLDLCAQSLDDFQQLYTGFSFLLEKTKQTRNEVN